MHLSATMADLERSSLFLDHQRRHSCTDCGHAYLDSHLGPAGEHFRRLRVGGGTIVANTDEPLRELHIVPHGGTELPADLLSAVDPADYPRLAQLVHENVDLGTAAIYRHLVDDIVAGRARGVAVAGFHLSRLLLDANRHLVDEQLPPTPYVGSADLYREYLLSEGRRLRVEALLPWLEAVDEVLREIGGAGTVYHHHTYDVYSMSPRPWDRGFTEKRPAFQLIWRRAPLSPTDVDPAETDPGLAPVADIEDVQATIRDFLEQEIGVGNGTGQIDYPLLLPVLPFRGTRVGDPPGAPRHLVYDLRKDLLATEQHIHSWVVVAPWRFRDSSGSTVGLAEGLAPPAKIS
ncbi:N-formylglutamate amidohydrolase [Micromonospora sp. WMMD1128]|uniref:N-formylglutamate amidohydrolase n=1 Tax=unclassified Micromonospora TaxID=2617518 RepID=UPI00248CD865|nr:MULTISPECIES: N-formylglutamate amidohydrolase [unclassified Micromonospora]WBB72866.1 N-formylglutamate amidohydrolase [Micromonospora sp. WMMD1128]WFE33687.1 N-formylglutamate amidohydrolase [Micromonospora sp. WMMD975]